MKKIEILMAVAVAIILASAILNESWQQKLDLTNYKKVDISTENHMIVLKNKCSGFFIETMPWKIDSIEYEKSSYEIQDTYNTITDVIDTLNGKPELVIIESKFGEKVYASLILKDRKKVDMDPSDAIAIAARSNVPIYVHNSIFDRYGKAVC